MNVNETFQKTEEVISNSAMVKIISIGILVLVLLIPSAMISSLMRERQARHDEVIREINQKWGASQIINGPFLSIPYKSYYKDEKNNVQFTTQYFHVLPNHLRISGNITPHLRHRGIYEAVLYNARIKVSGSFILPSPTQLNIEPEVIVWDKAFFSIGINDMRGIQDKITINFNGKEENANPGLKTADLAKEGVGCLLDLSASTRAADFAFNLNLNGSEQLQFIPLGEETTVEMQSSWPSPSFTGAFLPESRNVTDQGFSASWKVLHLNRNFPQFWSGKHFHVDPATFGVNLLIPANVYQKAIRMAKYALMFIVFTFSAFFCAEIISKQRIHPIQYLLIGLAVILFYVLLLSISEHIHFNYAYILASSATTLLITGYANAIVRHKNFTRILFLILVTLYSYLFVILQLEDYALIMGSIGLFLVLSVVMYLTRNVDWFGLSVANAKRNILAQNNENVSTDTPR